MRSAFPVHKIKIDFAGGVMMCFGVSIGFHRIAELIVMAMCFAIMDSIIIIHLQSSYFEKILLQD